MHRDDLGAGRLERRDESRRVQQIKTMLPEPERQVEMRPCQVAGDIQRTTRTAAAASAGRPAVEDLNFEVLPDRELLKKTGRVNAGPGQIAAGKTVVPCDLDLPHAAIAPGVIGRKEFVSTARSILFLRARARSSGPPWDF